MMHLNVYIVSWAGRQLHSSGHRSVFSQEDKFLSVNTFLQVILLTNDYKDDKALGSALVHSAAFWLMIILSLSLILPWAKLRKVPVRSAVLSSHAVQLFVDYGRLVFSHFRLVLTVYQAHTLSPAPSRGSRRIP